MRTIAVDIDDVLSTHAEDFIRFSNETWGTNLTVDDYDEDWEKMWGVSAEETASRSDELHSSGAIGNYGHRQEALQSLKRLKERFNLVIVTSRRRVIMKETTDWLESYFKGLFSEVHYAGMWDSYTSESAKATKADVCKQIGADYLIDDQLKHCSAAAEAGIPSLVFGDYKWNKSKDLHPLVSRVHSWQEVEDYFEDIK